MRASEAAVQAMAEALVGETADPFAIKITEHEAPFVARRVLAALATSPDVRAALMETLKDHSHWPSACCVAAILAALDPSTVTDDGGAT